MAMDKLFKGILQYKSTDTFTKEPGYIYLVREFVGTEATGNAEVWFGTRKYGNVEATKLAQIESDILALDGRVDAIEAALGTWESQLGTVAAVVKAHNDKLSGIEDTVENAINSAVSGKADTSTVTTLETRVGAIEDDYLKAADKTALESKITAAQSAANKAQGDVDVIAADYLKVADKTELDGKITAAQSAANKAQGDVDVIAADYLKAADKTALESKITAAQSAADAAQGDVDVIAADYLKSADKTELDGKITAHTENGNIHVTKQQKTDWQNATDAINAFLDENATTDNVINTLVEIREYLNGEDGSVETLLGKVDALEESVGTRAEGETAATGIFAEIADLNEVSHTHANKHVLDNILYFVEELKDLGDRETRESVLSAQSVISYVDSQAIRYGGADAE